jgi:hypothetical protein
MLLASSFQGGKCALPEQFTISITPLCTSCRHPLTSLGRGVLCIPSPHTLLNGALERISWIICKKVITETTFNNGSLGSRIDEERSEMRYVM